MEPSSQARSPPRTPSSARATSRYSSASWRPDGPARGVVVICHGFNSHSGQYAWAAEQFVAAGLAVYAADFRGRGRSEGERFYVEDIADYAADIAGMVAIAKEREPGLPVFLLGHSAGGVAAAIYVLDNPSAVSGFICESFAFQVPAPSFAIAAIKGLSHIAPHLPILKLKNEDFSRDPDRGGGARRRPADRQRDAAGAHRRRAGAGRRPPP